MISISKASSAHRRRMDTIQRHMGVSLDLVLRPIEKGDFHKGFTELLSQLTVTGDLTESKFNDRIDEIHRHGEMYHCIVIEDRNLHKIVASATLLVELKFARGCGKCGHIEDVVVNDKYRGERLGIRLIEELKRIGKNLGCYKIILDCTQANVPFYEKCGFVRKEHQMRWDVN